MSILLTPLHSKAQENFVKWERRVEDRSTQENVGRWRIALKCWRGEALQQEEHERNNGMISLELEDQQSCFSAHRRILNRTRERLFHVTIVI